MAKKPIIQFNHVMKQFDDDAPVLDHVSFEIEKGKFYTLLGPSGCGKTTILRLIAGFTEATSGDILFEGKRLITCQLISVQLIPFFKIMPCSPTLMYMKMLLLGYGLKRLKKQIWMPRSKKRSAL